MNCVKTQWQFVISLLKIEITMVSDLMSKLVYTIIVEHASLCTSVNKLDPSGPLIFYYSVQYSTVSRTHLYRNVHIVVVKEITADRSSVPDLRTVVYKLCFSFIHYCISYMQSYEIKSPP